MIFFVRAVTRGCGTHLGCGTMTTPRALFTPATWSEDDSDEEEHFREMVRLRIRHEERFKDVDDVNADADSEMPGTRWIQSGASRRGRRGARRGRRTRTSTRTPTRGATSARRRDDAKAADTWTRPGGWMIHGAQMPLSCPEPRRFAG